MSQAKITTIYAKASYFDKLMASAEAEGKRLTDTKEWSICRRCGRKSYAADVCMKCIDEVLGKGKPCQ